MSDPSYAPDIHHRRSLRLKEYDYSQEGAYFVTVCAQNRECLFGDITEGEIHLNDAGVIVRDAWSQTPEHFPTISMDAFVIMPNHFHGIIIVGAGSSRPGSSRPGSSRPLSDLTRRGREDRAPTIGNIVGFFKYQSTKQINSLLNRGFQKLWQRNYYDRVIREDADLNRIREYITNNPANWLEDELYA